MLLIELHVLLLNLVPQLCDGALDLSDLVEHRRKCILVKFVVVDIFAFRLSLIDERFKFQILDCLLLHLRLRLALDRLNLRLQHLNFVLHSFCDPQSPGLALSLILLVTSTLSGCYGSLEDLNAIDRVRIYLLDHGLKSFDLIRVHTRLV